MKYIAIVLMIFGLNYSNDNNYLNVYSNLAIEKISESKIDEGFKLFRIGYNATLYFKTQPDFNIIDKCVMLANKDDNNKKAASYYAIAMLLVYRTGNKTYPFELFDRAKEKDDTLAEIYNHKAVILIEMDKFKEAKELLDVAIKINPKYIDAIYNRSVVHHWLKEYNESVEDKIEYQKLTQP